MLVCLFLVPIHPHLHFTSSQVSPLAPGPPHYCDGHPLSSQCCTVTFSRPCWVSIPIFQGTVVEKAGLGL